MDKRVVTSKKGQFYIFASIMLSTILFSIYISNRDIYSPVKTDELSKNYIDEANNAINHAIMIKANVFDELNQYTFNFISYAKTRGKNFQTLYLLLYDNDLRIVNYLNDKANISNQPELLESGYAITLAKQDNLTITYKGVPYYFDFTDEPTQFKAIIIQE